ncbi:MAG: ATP synthase F1 subunit delta [Leeuwenhoekiella sp.]
MSTRAATRYAKAVLDLSVERNKVDAVYSDMTTIDDTLKSNRELRGFLDSPVIKNEDKRDALRQVFKDSSQTTFSLIDIVVDNNRASMLGDVAESFLDLYNKKEGIVIANVTTAVELNQELENKILAKVKEISGSSKVQLKHNIDPDIIGGFILRVGDIQYDASIENQLDKIEKEFTKSL